MRVARGMKVYGVVEGFYFSVGVVVTQIHRIFFFFFFRIAKRIKAKKILDKINYLKEKQLLYI